MDKEFEDFDFPVDEDKQKDKYALADRMLNHVRPGWTVSITRLMPDWCDGWLETVPVIDGEPLNLQSIVDRWGGAVLRIRILDGRGKFSGGVDLKVKSYPPKHKGTPIAPRNNSIDFTNHPTIKMAGAPDNPKPHQLPASAAAPSQIPQQTQPNIIDMLRLMQSARKEDLGLFQLLMGNLQNQQQPAPQQNGISQVVELAEQYKQLRGIFDGDGGGGNSGPSEEGQLLGSVTEIIKSLAMAKASSSPPAQNIPPARVVAPKQGQVQSGAPSVPPGQKPSIANQSPTLIAHLKEMPESKFISTFLTSLQSMPQDKSERIINTFMTGGLPSDAQPEPLNGGSDDEYYEEEEFEDDTETETDRQPEELPKT